MLYLNYLHRETNIFLSKAETTVLFLEKKLQSYQKSCHGEYYSGVISDQKGESE